MVEEETSINIEESWEDFDKEAPYLDEFSKNLNHDVNISSNVSTKKEENEDIDF